MRIGIDARLWNESGVGRYIRNLVNGVDAIEAKKANHSYVIFLRKDVFESVSFHSKSLQKVKADIRWHSIAEQVKFPSILEKERLDLVHFPYFSLPLSYKKPFVVTIHDLIIKTHATGKASTLPYPLYIAKQAAYSKVLRHGIVDSQAIIVPTEAVKKEILREYPLDEGKIHITYEGFDQSIIPKKESNQFGHLKNIPYFLYVGNAYPHKNLDTLLDGFELFRQKNPTYHLVVVGREDFFYKRLKQSKQNLESVLFYHSVDDKDLGYLYSHAKAYVTASRAEGFGLQLVESMHLGTPIICSDIPVFRELAHNTAFYFDPLNSASMANTMEKLVSTSLADLRLLVRQEKKRAKDFSWEKMVKETISVYESCVSL